MPTTFSEHWQRLLRPPPRPRSAVTVEAFGWLILVEGAIIFLRPVWAASLIQVSLDLPAANYFRLAGLLVSAVGFFYVVCGRGNAETFIFASLIDRPLVPPIMAVLWWLELMPGLLALAFSVQDFASFLWTLLHWRRERATTG
ncbi:MAG TPA: hypothetical protein VHF69_13605 [Candidatus Synoicihabitans sp.]|nr:hypothetical protein [Candidatus Synoicihabitans sp.]